MYGDIERAAAGKSGTTVRWTLERAWQSSGVARPDASAARTPSRRWAWRRARLPRPSGCAVLRDIPAPWRVRADLPQITRRPPAGRAGYLATSRINC